ncbi:uncharacterized protein LOC120597094 [Pteropus medius]|uniref:uncharacterized protein LOC120597094 n=1 Tax=Pteropus vampyrus TaxID=132908 RepID=UPI00196A38AD|nr:uncharacterized protein LOC120597094 [Pteropus giganteus]
MPHGTSLTVFKMCSNMAHRTSLTNLPHKPPSPVPTTSSPSPPRPMLMTCVHCGCSRHSCLSGCCHQTISPLNDKQSLLECHAVPGLGSVHAWSSLASRSTSVIWEGTQGPDAELGAFCALSSTRQDDSTGPFWKSLRTGLSPKEQRAFPAEHLAGARLLSSWAKSSLTRCHHVGFAPFTEDRETVGRIFLKTGRKAFATLSLCPQLSTKWTCSPPGTSFKG